MVVPMDTARRRATYNDLLPVPNTLKVYGLEGQWWVVASTPGGAESVRAEPFEAVEVDISRWWLES